MAHAMADGMGLAGGVIFDAIFWDVTGVYHKKSMPYWKMIRIGPGKFRELFGTPRHAIQE
jgi:hypothetical protein